MVDDDVAGEHAAMTKRIAAAVLWFYTAWYAGALFALMLGVSDVLGPILGIVAAVLFAGDPFGVIWKRPAGAHATSARAVAAPTVVLER